jgi:ABC-type molybdate transport system substrate-binding protein
VIRRFLLVAALAAFGACSGGDHAEAPPAVVVRVFAGTPLQPAFEELGEAFVETHDRMRVDFLFAEPAMLLGEVERGRAVAVLATGDTETMDNAERRGWVRDRFEVASSPDGSRVYEIALLTTAVAPTEAQQWVDFVRGVEGRAILEEHGFLVP